MTLALILIYTFLLNITECFDAESPLKCTLIINTITLTELSDEPTYNESYTSDRVKILNALKTAVRKDGRIYNLLNTSS